MATRRNFLRNLTLGASGMVLGPILRQIHAEAEGIGSGPPRFVFVVEGNGLDPRQVHPIGIPFTSHDQREKFESHSLRDLDLPAALEPVSEFKDRLTIVQGLSGRVAGGGHSNNFGALGAFDCQGGTANSGRAIDVTIDAALGKVHPGIFPIINLGISQNPADTVIYNASCWAPGKKLPTHCRPDSAFGMLFGSAATGDRTHDALAQRDLLDYLAADIRRVERGLGGIDRGTLPSYLAACESLRHRQNRLVEVRDQIAEVAPIPDDKYQSLVETDRLDAHFELVAAALISGVTNVATIASGVGDPYFNVRFRGLGIEVGKHAIGHHGSFGGLTSEEMATRIRRFHFQLIARLMQQLDSVPERDGTMLDNTVIVYLSDAAEAHHSSCWEWPFVLLGKLGSRHHPGGAYLAYPGYGKQGHRTINNLYCTLLQAAGAPCNQFGHVDPQLNDLDQTGPLVELIV